VKASVSYAPAQPPSQSTVLVVEDDEVLRLCAEEVVADAGFSPVEAANADEAFAILENRSDIALLFTDTQMPGSMDGLDLTRIVRDRWPAIKIILVSGRAELSERERPINSRFYQKPFAMKQMIEGLQEMISSLDELRALTSQTRRKPVSNRYHSAIAMSGDQSRLLKVGEYVD
jgi:CheY-like chemotaxis protein